MTVGIVAIHHPRASYYAESVARPREILRFVPPPAAP
jgi:hypothetical protein